MKIKKAIELCKSRKQLVIYDEHTKDGGLRQWCSDGAASYLMLGAPYLDKDTISPLYDISDKVVISQGEMIGYDTSDYCSDDEVVVPLPVSIIHYGKTLQPLIGKSGAVWINAQYLLPLADDKGLRLVVRSKGKTPFVVAMDGLFAEAIIMPIQTDDLMRELRKLI